MSQSVTLNDHFNHDERFDNSLHFDLFSGVAGGENEEVETLVDASPPRLLSSLTRNTLRISLLSLQIC